MNYYLLAGTVGLLSGIISGMFGVGGGIVMVPAMMFLLGVKDIKIAIGTSLAVIIPTVLVGTFRHHQLGKVDWPTVLTLAPTAILGGFVGVWLTTQISSDNLKRAFGAFTMLAGLRFLLFK